MSWNLAKFAFTKTYRRFGGKRWLRYLLRHDQFTVSTGLRMFLVTITQTHLYPQFDCIHSFLCTVSQVKPHSFLSSETEISMLLCCVCMTYKYCCVPLVCPSGKMSRSPLSWSETVLRAKTNKENRFKIHKYHKFYIFFLKFYEFGFCLCCACVCGSSNFYANLLFVQASHLQCQLIICSILTFKSHLCWLSSADIT